MFRAVLATTGSPGLQEETSGVLVLDVTRPGALADALGDDDTPVLITSHPVHEYATRLACTLLRGHREDLLFTHQAFHQAPLANLVALRIAQEVAVDAGHAAALWRDLSDAIWSAAIVPGVARLPHPNPSLVQHARSLLPGSRYLVRLHPDAEVIGSKKLAAALEPLGRGQVHVHATRTDPDDTVMADLVQQVAPVGLETREVPGDWSVLFGRREQVQIAAVPTAYAEMLRPRGGPCHSCGLSAVDPVCSFCGIRGAVRNRPSALEPTPTTATTTVGAAVGAAPGRTT